MPWIQRQYTGTELPGTWRWSAAQDYTRVVGTNPVNRATSCLVYPLR
jgi:hypothetical protein